MLRLSNEILLTQQELGNGTLLRIVEQFVSPHEISKLISITN